jgi:hypothetical protein
VLAGGGSTTSAARAFLLFTFHTGYYSYSAASTRTAFVLQREGVSVAFRMFLVTLLQVLLPARLPLTGHLEPYGLHSISTILTIQRHTFA